MFQLSLQYFNLNAFPKQLKKLNDIAYKMLQMSHKRLNPQMLR